MKSITNLAAASLGVGYVVISMLIGLFCLAASADLLVYAMGTNNLIVYFITLMALYIFAPWATSYLSIASMIYLYNIPIVVALLIAFHPFVFGVIILSVGYIGSSLKR